MPTPSAPSTIQRFREAARQFFRDPHNIALLLAGTNAGLATAGALHGSPLAAVPAAAAIGGIGFHLQQRMRQNLARAELQSEVEAHVQRLLKARFEEAPSDESPDLAPLSPEVQSQIDALVAEMVTRFPDANISVEYVPPPPSGDDEPPEPWRGPRR